VEGKSGMGARLAFSRPRPKPVIFGAKTTKKENEYDNFILLIKRNFNFVQTAINH